MKEHSKVRIAICFFGITRSLSYTIASIDRNVLEPAERMGDVVKLAHFFDLPRIENRRSGEYVAHEVDADKYLHAEEIETSKPQTAEIMVDFKKLKTFGDTWKDDFASLDNLTHQLHSLQKVTRMSQKYHAEIVLFIRPDLNYHDSLGPIIRRALKVHHAGKAAVFTPDWQRWGGVNDRFAVAVGEKAYMAYGNRLMVGEEFCSKFNRSLVSEHLVAHAMERAQVNVVHIPQRASRVRANGIQAWEDFDRFFPRAIQRRLDGRIKRRSKILYELLTFANNMTAQVVWGNRYANIDPPEGVVQRSKAEEVKLRSLRT